MPSTISYIPDFRRYHKNMREKTGGHYYIVKDIPNSGMI